MGNVMMDSMGWPYDSVDCLLLIQEFGTDCFCLVIEKIIDFFFLNQIIDLKIDLKKYFGHLIDLTIDFRFFLISPDN